MLVAALAPGLCTSHGAALRSRGDKKLRSIQVVRKAVVGARETIVGGVLVGHRQEATDAAGHGILCHRRIGVVPELVQAGVAEAQAQLAGVAQVLGNLFAEKLERPVDA